MKKKILIGLTAISIISQSNSEYIVKIPLSQDNVDFYKWNEMAPIFGDWINQDNLYDCTNWQPDSSTIEIGKSFIQTANDCKQQQIRTVQNRKVDEISGNIQNDGSPYNESRTINVSNTRTSIGSKETWIEIEPTYTSWVEGSLTCSDWFPDPSMIDSGKTFTQTSTNCVQLLTRTRQDREEEITTKIIRNKGNPIIETDNIIISSNRTATGTKPIAECRFEVYSENWRYAWYSEEWNDGADRTYVYIYWDGWKTGLNTNRSNTVITHGGYKYTKGNYMKTDPDYGDKLYQICREPI